MSEADYRDLSIASWRNDFDKIQDLIKKGCSVNHIYESRPSDLHECHTTLLIHASDWSDVNIVKYLLNEGADAYIRTPNSDKIAIDFALSNSHHRNKDDNLEVIKMLINALDVEYIEEMSYYSSITHCFEYPNRFILHNTYVSLDMFNNVITELGWKRRKIIIIACII